MDNEKIKINLNFVIMVFILILIAVLPSCSGEKNKPSGGKGFYEYSDKKLNNLLKKNGYEDVAIRYVDRNSDGTKLRIYDSDERIFIFSCDGSMKVIDTPGTAWVNDEDQIVAWLDGKQDKVIYKNGFSENPPIWFRSIDPSGKYFAKRAKPILIGNKLVNTEKSTRIFSIDQPDKLLVKLDNVDSNILKLFYKNNTVYVFTDIEDNKNVVFILQKKNNKLEVEKTINIPNPSNLPRFQVMDFCPWSDEVMLVNPLDWPSKSKLYTFNLTTGEMKKAGNQNGWGYYLQCDILKQNK